MGENNTAGSVCGPNTTCCDDVLGDLFIPLQKVVLDLCFVCFDFGTNRSTLVGDILVHPFTHHQHCVVLCNLQVNRSCTGMCESEDFDTKSAENMSLMPYSQTFTHKFTLTLDVLPAPIGTNHIL